MIDEEISSLIDLVKLDYENTLAFVDGVVRVSMSIRAIATAVWLGLIAASIQIGYPWLALLAALGVTVLGLQDAYHGWLYAEARRRAFELEGLLDGYYKYLQRKSKPDAGTDLLKALHNHRFGQLSRLPRLERRSELVKVVRNARPAFFYRYLYLPLFMMGLIVAIVVAASNGDAAGSSTSQSALPAKTAPTSGTQTESRSQERVKRGH